MKILLEAAVDSLDAAIAAEQAGADRLELCAALELGGLTPGIGLVREVCAAVHIPVYVLLRPRSGGFCYTAGEHKTLVAEVEALHGTGAAGVVIGALDIAGQLNIPYMQDYLNASAGLGFTCHRAFDRIADQSTALEKLIDLGVPRVLSSGGHPGAYEGMEQLRKLVEQAAGRITILAGAGVSPANAHEIVEATRTTEIHFSAIQRIQVSSNSSAVSMGKDDKGDWAYVPDPEKVRGIRGVV